MLAEKINKIWTPPEGKEQSDTSPNERMLTTEIVSTTAYLCGIRKEFFENDFDPLELSIYEKLNGEKSARILRNLCLMRVSIQKNFRQIRQQMEYDRRPTASIEEFPTKAMSDLRGDGVEVFNYKYTKVIDYIIRINELIVERVDAVRRFYPAWVNWTYMKNVFIMPGGTTHQGQAAATKTYYENKLLYPYQTYINWKPESQGNIFASDKKFLQIIYQQNGDTFEDLNRVQDVPVRVRNAFHDFIVSSGKTVFVVDCENADPYAFCATIRDLDAEMKEKIVKIILCDDPNSSAAWRVLDKYTDVPVEHIMTERVLQRKSVVDIKLTAEVCKEHYQNSVDSFVLTSSDSDYFSLITSIPQARFLVMMEKEKSCYELKQRLIGMEITFANMEEFYTGNDNRLLTMTLLKEMRDSLQPVLQVNAKELLHQAVIKSRANMKQEDEDAFYKQWVKPMHLVLSETGEVDIRFGKE